MTEPIDDFHMMFEQLKKLSTIMPTGEDAGICLKMKQIILMCVCVMLSTCVLSHIHCKAKQRGTRKH